MREGFEPSGGVQRLVTSPYEGKNHDNDVFDTIDVVGFVVEENMASLRRLPDTRNWIACFTDVTGRRLQRSTGTYKRKEAMMIAWKFEEAARKLKTEAQIRRVMSDLFESISSEPLPWAPSLSFSEAGPKGKMRERRPYGRALRGRGKAIPDASWGQVEARSKLS